MSNRVNLLVKIANLYYEEGITQTEIAKTLNLSRPTVSSMLQEAKDKGIVKIIIQHTNQNTVNLQNHLKEKYGLKTVLIATTETDNVKTEVGSLCASLVEDMLPSIKTVGLSWGTTIYEYVQQASYFDYNHLAIVPLIGGIGNDNVKFHSNHLSFMLSEKYNCQVNYFYAPAVAETLKQKNNFIQSELVSHVIEIGKSVDLAIVGVGNPNKSSTFKNMKVITEQELSELKDNQVIGDVGTTFFDEKGEVVETQVSDRMIGISIADLKKIPDVVVLASGAEKCVTVKALLKKGMINHLIIDSVIAKEL